MRTTTQYTIWHGLAIGGAVLAQGADLANNLEYATELSGRLIDSTNLVILGVAVGSIVCAGAIGQAYRQRAWFWLPVLAATWCICAAFSLAISADRLATQRDDRLAKREAVSNAGLTARRLFEQANKNVERYCIPSANVRRRSRDEFRQKCVYWQAREKVERIAATRSRPVMAADPLGLRVTRVIQIISGWRIDPKDVGLIVPMLAPAGLILLGAVLAAFGAAGMRVHPEFDLSLNASAADEAKAVRFMLAWHSMHGRSPSAAELARGIGINRDKARRLHSRIVAA